MIFRLSQKLNTKIKAGKLSEMPLDKTPMSALTDAEGRKYGYSREVFKRLDGGENRAT
jgi:hypothetical protein